MDNNYPPENDKKTDKFSSTTTDTTVVTTPGLISRAVSRLQNNPIKTAIAATVATIIAVGGIRYNRYGAVLPSNESSMDVAAAAASFSSLFNQGR